MKLRPLLEDLAAGKKRLADFHRTAMLLAQQGFAEAGWTCKVTKLHWLDDETGEVHPVQMTVTNDDDGNYLPCRVAGHAISLSDKHIYLDNKDPLSTPPEHIAAEIEKAYAEKLEDVVEKVGDNYHFNLDDIMRDCNDDQSEAKPKALKLQRETLATWLTDPSKESLGIVNSLELAKRLAPKIEQRLKDTYSAVFD